MLGVSQSVFQPGCAFRQSPNRIAALLHQIAGKTQQVLSNRVAQFGVKVSVVDTHHLALGSIRAGTLDLETVAALGVNVRALRSINFGLGIYLAGLAGVLAAVMLGLQPTIGTSLIMPSFVAIIVGGLGSLPGTLLGGLLIGVASGLATVFLPAASEAIIYVMMGLVLLLRPRGLLGEEGRLR